MAENPAQQIVEVVGDAAGEGPDPLQAARLPQTAFQSRALRFHRMTRDGGRMVSSAMRKRLSSPDAEIQSVRPIASKPSDEIVPFLPVLVTQAQPPRPSLASVFLASQIGTSSTRGA